MMTWKNDQKKMRGEFHMVGFLCNQRKEKYFANYMRNNMDLKNLKISVIVFSMQNINLNDNTVYGSMISDGAVTTLTTALPSLVFNFAVQHSNSNIKKLKQLIEVENLTLINPANSFNQWSIMKMLTSNPKSKQYVLPFVDIPNENAIPDIQKIGNFIIKPQNGSDFKKIIYCRKTDLGFDLYNIGEITYSHLFDIQSAIMPTIRKGKWILLSSPELISYNNKLLIIRNYMHRDCDGTWKVILKTTISQTEQIYKKAYEKIDAALLDMMNDISCFVPDLSFCSVDIVLSSDGTPYFLSLGGWQDIRPGKSQHKILLDILCQSIAVYAEKY